MVDPFGFISLYKRVDAAFRARTGVPVWLPGAVCIAYYMVLYGDVFGLEGASSERSGQVALRIAAPLYKASDSVVTVMIDDAYLTSRQASWPLRYAEQGAIMRRILAAGPSGLVVDFIYPHRHGKPAAAVADPDPITDLTKYIDDNTQIPVIFTALARVPPDAKSNHKPEDDTHELPEVRCRRIDKLAVAPVQDAILNSSSIDPLLLNWINADRTDARPRRIAYIGWSECGERYPNFFEGDPEAATPAFAAFRAYCETHGDLEACKHKGPGRFLRTEGSPQSYLEPMTLRSGAYPPENQAFSYKSQCQELAGRKGYVPLFKRTVGVARQLAFSTFGDPRNSPRHDIALPCPAITVLPYSHLAGASPEQWQELIKGRFVVLGASIAGIPDVVPTAVHGQMAGVNWHAMALDNLLTNGAEYLHEPGFWEERIFVTLLALVFAYSFPMLAKVYEHDGLKRFLAAASLVAWLCLGALYLSSGQKSLAFTAALLGISLDVIKPTYSAVYFFALLIAAAASFLLNFLGLASGNWIGLVLVVAGISHTLKAYYKGEEAKRLPHPLSVLKRLWNLGVRHAIRE